MRLRYLFSTFAVAYVAALVLVLFFGQGVLGNAIAAVIAFCSIAVAWYSRATLTKRQPHRRVSLFQTALLASMMLLVISVVHFTGAYADLQPIERITWAFTPVLLLFTAGAIYLSFTKDRYKRHT
ncbi:MAG TPA: hypothetical protein VFS65_02655 [Candidatus Saccharimonadales bacterium]|nr:hypothetical protein [Candidatus Saccharimonadales bacterium]